jgi:hypothetical protein
MICQSLPQHTLNEKYHSNRALTASCAACSPYPQYFIAQELNNREVDPWTTGRNHVVAKWKTWH